MREKRSMKWRINNLIDSDLPILHKAAIEMLSRYGIRSRHRHVAGLG